MSSNDTKCPASTAPCHIGRAVRDLVAEVVKVVCPKMTRLSLEEVIGSKAKVQAWLELIPLFGKLEIEGVERAIKRLKGAELADAAARLAQLDELRTSWRKRLEEARAADETYRAQKAVKPAAPSPEAKPAGSTLGDIVSPERRAELEAVVAPPRPTAAEADAPRPRSKGGRRNGTALPAQAA